MIRRELRWDDRKKMLKCLKIRRCPKNYHFSQLWRLEAPFKSSMSPVSIIKSSTNLAIRKNSIVKRRGWPTTSKGSRRFLSLKGSTLVSLWVKNLIKLTLSCASTWQAEKEALSSREEAQNQGIRSLYLNRQCTFQAHMDYSSHQLTTHNCYRIRNLYWTGRTRQEVQLVQFHLAETKQTRDGSIIRPPWMSWKSRTAW